MFNFEELVVTEEELHTLCREWQEILNMEYWAISLRIARKREFITEGSVGECNWNVRKAHAYISILDPVDFSDGIPQDMERTLVHELLHCHFAPFDNFETGTLEDSMLERAVDAIASALIGLKRKGMKDECQKLASSKKERKVGLKKS